MINPSDKWKIRFGQVFQTFLRNSGKKLEDFLYFQPAGVALNPKAEDNFNKIDLHKNRPLFDAHFANNALAVPALDPQAIKKVADTFVIIPGFGHHTIEQLTFGDQLPIFKELGVKVVYAKYQDSFASNKKCARAVADIIKEESRDNEKIVFLTYSKGSPIAIELLNDPSYTDIAKRTKAVISFAGALRGTPHATTKTARTVRKLLKAYKKAHQKGIFKRLANIAISSIAWLPVKQLKERKKLLKKVNEFADDLADLPEGIMQLGKAWSRSEFANVQLPNHIKLFSLSAVYPEADFKGGLEFISNPDDLFLYISGRGLYKHNVFNDTQVLLPDSEFFTGMGDIINLGIVKTDHWGITMPRVFSRKFEDPFPRTEMLKAALVVLTEYFS